jgi:hypothetical protein
MTMTNHTLTHTHGVYTYVIYFAANAFILDYNISNYVKRKASSVSAKERNEGKRLLD